MVGKPRDNYRELDISFQEFKDLLIIGMSGYSDHLLSKETEYFVDGMINYESLAKALGLKYESIWLEYFGNEVDDQGLVTHDQSPYGEDSDTWVYLNPGFQKIGELLFEKYYLDESKDIPDVINFKNELLVNMASRHVEYHDEYCETTKVNPYSFDLDELAKYEEIVGRELLLPKARKSLLEDEYITLDSESDKEKYFISDKGFKAAESIAHILYPVNTVAEPSPSYFTVDASHITRLGLELVAKQETAVAELIKNSYDADATEVEISFKFGKDHPEEIIVKDNGTGMSLKQLKLNFLRLSTTNKIASPVSEIYQRQKAGRKGIGRFAAQRLGKILILETTKSDSPHASQLKINWDDFSSQKSLSEIPININLVSKSFEKGTQIRILDLRDGWSDREIEQSLGHISELIQPFPLNASDKYSKTDPGFKVSFTKISDGEKNLVWDEWQLFFKHAIAEIDGIVDSSGHGYWEINAEKFNIKNVGGKIGPDVENAEIPYKHLKNINFKAYYYIDKEMPRIVSKQVGEKLRVSGGIRLYRNGFRVLPYGERFDDWLKLNSSNLQRSILPPHSNRNFLGFVEIQDIEGKVFEETSSREGLLENNAFIELKDFVSSAIKSSIKPIATARNKFATTQERREKLKSPQQQAKAIVRSINSIRSISNSDGKIKREIEEAFDDIKSTILELGNQGQGVLEELGMMRVLASLGLTIGEFTHEIKLSLEAIKSAAILNDNKLSSGTNSIISKISDFESYLNYFDNTIRDNVKREQVPCEARDIINKFISIVKPKVNRNELTIDKEFSEYGLYLTPMHLSEWNSIFVNLFTNSLKAIRRAGVKGNIKLVSGRLDDKIFIDFMDNGDGISEGIRDKIFDAFVTTTSGSKYSENDDELSGMGLGLKIVKDIVTSGGGQIFLTQPQSGYNTCFRILFQQAAEDEIPENDY